MLQNIFIMIAATAIAHGAFRRNPGTGLGVAVFFLVFVPSEVRIPLPGALPELTIQRLLLLLCAAHVLPWTNPMTAGLRLPGLRFMVAVLVVRTISTATGTTFVGAMKELFSFALESLLFYIVAGRVLTDRSAVFKVAWGAVLALTIVAGIAAYERYTGNNLATILFPWKANSPRFVEGTFRHRILLGYAMAMGFPLAVGLAGVTAWRSKRAAQAAMFLMAVAVYFSNSRGPWVGIALAIVTMGLTGSRALRWRLVIVGIVAVGLLLAKPGVFSTILNKWFETTNVDHVKGHSANYRLELWKVAAKKLSESPVRFLFGFGGGSLEEMQLGGEFEFGGGSGSLGHTSWDSEYAADLMKYGWLGFLLEMTLFCQVGLLALSTALRATGSARQLLAGCAGCAVVYLWAMTNVAVFNPQLTFLFWSVVAILARASQLPWPLEAESNHLLEAGETEAPYPGPAGSRHPESAFET